MQWRIQDFTEEGELTPKAAANLLFGQFFLKTSWKWKKFRPEGEEHTSLAPLLRSATAMYLFVLLSNLVLRQLEQRHGRTLLYEIYKYPINALIKKICTRIDIRYKSYHLNNTILNYVRMEDTDQIDYAVGCLDGSDGIFTDDGKKSLTFSKSLSGIECKFHVFYKNKLYLRVLHSTDSLWPS